MTILTVGMPTYNAEASIGEAIESVLAQSFSDFTLVISDNASTDATEQVCREYMSRDIRIRYIRQDENLGATENYNFVCRQAQTPYFKWQSSNDFLSIDAIASCIKSLEANPDAVLCYPKTYLFESSVSDAKPYDDAVNTDASSAVERCFHVFDKMKLNNVMNGVVRTKDLLETSLIREFYYADRNMVAELALRGKILEAKSGEFYRRMDEESATSLKSPEEVMAHFDPRWTRPLSYMTWRIYFAMYKSIATAGIGIRQSLVGWSKLSRRMWWARGHLMTDIALEIKYAKAKFKFNATN